jgi:hypothetical protein
MMSLKKSMDEKKFDTRLIDLHVQTGKITEAEYKQYLESLKDQQDNATILQLDLTSDSEESSSTGNSLQ